MWWHGSKEASLTKNNAQNNISRNVRRIIAFAGLFVATITMVACPPESTNNTAKITCTGGGTTRTEGEKTITTVCAEQLKTIANNVKPLSGVTYAGGLLPTSGLPSGTQVKYIYGNYELGGDIDLSSDTSFTGIGSLLVPFAGTFDGKGHSVKLATSVDTDYVGLFGVIGINSAYVDPADKTAIDDLNNTIVVKNVKVIGSVTGRNYVGGVAGIINAQTVIGYSEANIVGKGDIGGFAGSLVHGTVTGYSTGSVVFTDGTGTNGKGFIGSVDTSLGNAHINGGYFDKTTVGKLDGENPGVKGISAAANIYKYTGANETGKPDPQINRENGKFYDNKGDTDSTNDVLIFDHAEFIKYFDLEKTADGSFPLLKMVE